MSQGTALIAFKQVLITRLAARPALDGVQVSYEYPDSKLTGEDIWLGDAECEAWIPVHRAGKKKVDESIMLDVIIQVLKRQGESQLAADIRANELFAEVQSDLAEEPQNTQEVLWGELAGWEHMVGVLPSGGGHGSRFALKVRVRARLF